MPEYLRRMAAHIDVVISRKGVTRKDAITSAIAISASFTYGVVPLSWLDIILHVNEHRGDENYADDLSGLVQAACPEYAKKITNWKHLKNIATRLASRTIHALEREMIRHGLPFHSLPISWFREAWILTAPDEDAPPPGKKQRVGRPSNAPQFLSEAEQVLAVTRTLADAAKAAHASTEPIDNPNMLGRCVGEAERKLVVTLAKKLEQGLQLAGADLSADAAEGIRKEFEAGTLDSELRMTVDVEAQAHFWTFLKRARDVAEDALEASLFEKAPASAAELEQNGRRVADRHNELTAAAIKDIQEKTNLMEGWAVVANSWVIVLEPMENMMNMSYDISGFIVALKYMVSSAKEVLASGSPDFQFFDDFARAVSCHVQEFKAKFLLFDTAMKSMKDPEVTLAAKSS